VPQGYESPEKFDPDRFSPERKEDVKFASNYLVFGHGPHYCVGKEYAQNHLAAFLARLASSVDITRLRTKVSVCVAPCNTSSVSKSEWHDIW
jgi:cytochrome P450 family 710 subfamily A protein